MGKKIKSPVNGKTVASAKSKAVKKKKTIKWVGKDMLWKSMEFAKKHPIEFAEGW
jgi:hypothetical protein